MIQTRDRVADDNGNPSDRWAFLVDGKIVAELHIDDDDIIVGVDVETSHQGQGLATRLYQLASAARTVLHSPPEHRTPSGDRWARSVGGDVADPCELCRTGKYH